MMDDKWIEDLLDKGIGALAVKHLYRMKRNLPTVTVCPVCGYELGKWGVTCPKCRRSIN